MHPRGSCREIQRIRPRDAPMPVAGLGSWNNIERLSGNRPGAQPIWLQRRYACRARGHTYEDDPGRRLGSRHHMHPRSTTRRRCATPVKQWPYAEASSWTFRMHCVRPAPTQPPADPRCLNAWFDRSQKMRVDAPRSAGSRLTRRLTGGRILNPVFRLAHLPSFSASLRGGRCTTRPPCSSSAHPIRSALASSKGRPMT